MNILSALLAGLSLFISPLRASAGNIASAAPAALPRAVGPVLSFQLTPQQITQRYASAKAQLEAALRLVVTLPADQRTFANTVKAMESASADFSDAVEPMSILGYVAADPSVREAARGLEEEAGQYQVALWARPEIYRAFKQYADKKETLTGEDARLFEETERGFKSSGHALSEADRAKLSQIRQRLTVLSTQFEANIADDQGFIDMSIEDLKGMSEDYIASLKRTPEGKYRVTLAYPHYVPFMDGAHSAEMRRRLWTKFNNRAAEKNPPLMVEALRLRDESATLLGYPSFPAMQLENRMAKGPRQVMDFLKRLYAMLRDRGQAELKAMLEVKLQDDPTAKRLEAWETSYYGEKLRKAKFAFDEEEVAKYFPVDQVVGGTMRVYEKLFGVKFSEVPAEGAHHPDVRLLRVDDAAGGGTLGSFYLDLYPREGKYTHAAVAGLIKGRELENGRYQRPVALMMANFPAAVPGKPALMRHEDAVTYMHEFGHGLHQIFTKAKYASFSGTSVARDFVETPSQMLENFAWQREVLDEISGHYEDASRKLPAELFEKMLAARSFNKGLLYLRQIAFGMADMTLHMIVPKETSMLFGQFMELVGLLPSPDGVKREASFGHLMAGYSAGYYGYLWSEVLADDAFTRFAKEGVLNSVVGMLWRREVLEKGSSRPEIDSMRAYLGREPNEDAFIQKLLQ